MRILPRPLHFAIILISLGAALFFYHLFTPDHSATVNVLITSNSKKLGDPVLDTDLRWASWPKAYDQEHFIHTEKEKEQLLHRTVSGFLSRGEPMTFDKVRAPTVSSAIAQQLSPENRALTLAFDSHHHEASLLQIGDHVDVIWTHKVKTDKDQKIESQILAENILVLDRDQTAGRGNYKITLDVKADLAQKILLAKEKGKISFLLRGHRCESPSGLCALSEDGLMLKRQKINYTLGKKSELRDIK